VLVGVIVGGILLLIIAIALLIWALSRPGARTVVSVPGPAALAGAYPARVEGVLDPGLSRWLWLVKWLLAIPHYIVLFFLWIGFALLTIIAWFAILFTGRYPKGIFDFNVGVLRWSWRVSYYSYSPLATDRYPPFSLADSDYPARLDVAYPESLSRGLALIKWWLLAIPHYIVVAVLTGGAAWWYQDAEQGDGIGLIGILTFFAVVALLFTARYPRGLFDLVMGLNRWVLRVVVYAALMRDEYPPFRLDMGGEEPSPTERGSLSGPDV
jgi:hypothetical protein